MPGQWVGMGTGGILQKMGEKKGQSTGRDDWNWGAYRGQQRNLVQRKPRIYEHAQEKPPSEGGSIFYNHARLPGAGL